ARADDNVTCTFTNTQKAAPQLKIVKSCPNGAAATTDRFQPQNGSTEGAALACGGSTTITLTPAAADCIPEVAGSTTPATSLSNYDTTYSTDCANASGWPRGTELKTCTITNTLKSAPGVTINKDCPNGAYAGTDRFQPKDGTTDAGSAIACGGSRTHNRT